MEIGSIQKIILEIIEAQGKIFASDVAKLYREDKQLRGRNMPKYPITTATMMKLELMKIVKKLDTQPISWMKGENFDKYF